MMLLCKVLLSKTLRPVCAIFSHRKQYWQIKTSNHVCFFLFYENLNIIIKTTKSIFQKCLSYYPKVSTQHLEKLHESTLLLPLNLPYSPGSPVPQHIFYWAYEVSCSLICQLSQSFGYFKCMNGNLHTYIIPVRTLW